MKYIVPMAASVYKWLLSLLLVMTLTSFRTFSLHPFHVSVLEIEHNASNKSLEISCKIFTDDFETVLAKKYNTKVDLINPPLKSAMDTLVKKYILSQVSIKVNGKPAVLNYVGFENESEAAYSYFEIENITVVSKVEITNSILHDKFDDQVNIMHVKAGGKRESTKLNYPNKLAVINF